MRGSSRREDMAHWILSLKEAGEPGQPAHHTTFSTEFTKCRNCTGAEARPPAVDLGYLHHPADAGV